MFTREVDLFKGIATHVIDEIAKLAVEEVYPKGKVLFKRDDFADSLYILEDGRVDLVIQGDERFSFPLNQPGYVFGWSALVEPNRYTATAECVEESKAIKLDGDRLMRVFEKHPMEGLTIMKRLAGVIGTRLDTIYQRFTSSR
jgi:CRP/FNR family transcriptional regulator, cyclic AMP receptor protein